jgi:hypothetical protein
VDVGIVCVQAIACGKPVMATRCGGPEYIVTPESGLVLEAANPEQMAEALNQMFKSQKTIQRQFAGNLWLDFPGLWCWTAQSSCIENAFGPDFRLVGDTVNGMGDRSQHKPLGSEFRNKHARSIFTARLR